MVIGIRKVNGTVQKGIASVGLAKKITRPDGPAF
jgi:hypothetical protein